MSQSPAPAAATRRDRRRAAQQRLRLSRTQERASEKLAAWKREADRRATFLDAATVWSLLDEVGDEAEELEVLQELKEILFIAAGRMADPRMLKAGLRYYKFGDGR